MNGDITKGKTFIYRGLWMRRIQCCFISFHYAASTRPEFYLRNANATTHQEKQCHILIKRSLTNSNIDNK